MNARDRLVYTSSLLTDSKSGRGGNALSSPSNQLNSATLDHRRTVLELLYNRSLCSAVIHCHSVKTT